MTANRNATLAARFFHDCFPWILLKNITLLSFIPISHQVGLSIDSELTPDWKQSKDGKLLAQREGWRVNDCRQDLQILRGCHHLQYRNALQFCASLPAHENQLMSSLGQVEHFRRKLRRIIRPGPLPTDNLFLKPNRHREDLPDHVWIRRHGINV